MTTSTDWQQFLDRHATSHGFEKASPASEEQIAVVEAKLNLPLPPSYRTFLQTSNGLRSLSPDRLGLREVSKLKWFRKEHREWTQAVAMTAQAMESPLQDNDYFGYETVDCVKFEPKHVPECLCISNTVDEAVVLLNPMVVWPDGEWEVWYFSNALPGAIRFRSFEDWMHSEQAGFVDTPRAPKSKEAPWPTVFRDGPSKPERRTIKQQIIPALQTVLKNLQSPKEKIRAKAVAHLACIGGPEAIAALINTLRNDPDPSTLQNVRLHAAKALGRIGAPEAIDPLIAAIEDPAVNSSAVHALGQIKDSRAVDYLFEFARARGQFWGAAAYLLTQRGDERLIPFLVHLAQSDKPEDSRDAERAISIISDYRNEAALAALEPLTSHLSLPVREQATNALFHMAYQSKTKEVTTKARALLARCAETETDENLRQSIIRSQSILSKR